MEKVLRNLLVDVKTIATRGEDQANAIAEVDAFIAMQTNADEVMHTTKVGGGKEVIPTEVFGDALLNLVPSYSYLLPLLPGNHGSGLNLLETLPIIGEADIFKGNSEWTTGSSAITPDGSKTATGSISITQGQFILNIALSKRELAYSVVDLERVIRERINLSAARTIDAFILNADSATSGNINYDGGTPAVGSYYLQGATGLRKVGLTNSVDVGTFDDADVLAMLDALGDYASDPSMLILAVNRKVYNKMLGFTNTKTYDKSSTNATILKGVLANIYGVDVLVHRDVPALAQATGKVSSTGASNTLGTAVMFYKPAVQYGFGKVQDFEVTNVAGKGVILTSTFEFGFAIPTGGTAGLPEMVTTAKNITV